MLRPIVVAGLLATLVALSVRPVVAAQSTPEPTMGIPPLVWQLTQLTPASTGATPSAGGAVTPDDPSRYTVQFLPDGSIFVRADCNSGGGSYQRNGTSLTIDSIITTMVACPPESLSNPFLQTLQTATSVTISDDALVISASDGGELQFAPSLLGVTWEWVGFAGGDDSQVTPDDPSKYTVTFNPEGGFNVKADCNVGTGSYTVDAPSLDLTVQTLTRAACPPASLSEQFLRTLDDTVSFVFQGGQLHLSLMADAGIASFSPQLPQPEATPVAN